MKNFAYSLIFFFAQCGSHAFADLDPDCASRYDSVKAAIDDARKDPNYGKCSASSKTSDPTNAAGQACVEANNAFRNLGSDLTAGKNKTCKDLADANQQRKQLLTRNLTQMTVRDELTAFQEKWAAAQNEEAKRWKEYQDNLNAIRDRNLKVANSLKSNLSAQPSGSGNSTLGTLSPAQFNSQFNLAVNGIAQTSKGAQSSIDAIGGNGTRDSKISTIRELLHTARISAKVASAVSEAENNRKNAKDSEEKDDDDDSNKPTQRASDSKENKTDKKGQNGKTDTEDPDGGAKPPAIGSGPSNKGSTISAPGLLGNVGVKDIMQMGILGLQAKMALDAANKQDPPPAKSSDGPIKNLDIATGGKKTDTTPPKVAPTTPQDPPADPKEKPVHIGGGNPDPMKKEAKFDAYGSGTSGTRNPNSNITVAGAGSGSGTGSGAGFDTKKKEDAEGPGKGPEASAATDVPLDSFGGTGTLGGGASHFNDSSSNSGGDSTVKDLLAEMNKGMNPEEKTENAGIPVNFSDTTSSDDGNSASATENRKPASAASNAGDLDNISLFKRLRTYHDRCLKKGCVMFGVANQAMDIKAKSSKH